MTGRRSEMSIFDVIENDNFFKPFCSKNKSIYYDCICELIQKSKGRPVLYEMDARDCLNIYLNNTQLEYVEETDDISQTTITKSGADIIRYFRECGWMSERELGRNGEYETHVTPYCRRIIDFLQDLTQKNKDGSLSNKLINMYDILQSTFTENSIRNDMPYTHVLNPLLENMEGLKDELFDLKENIGRIMMETMDLQNMKKIGDFMLKDVFLEKFFNDYFYIKNNGTIAFVIGQIKELLRQLNSEEWISKMALDYVRLNNDKTEKEAREFVDNSLMDIRVFLTDDYPDYIDQIEAQINNYYSLAHSKIAMFSKSGMNIELALDKFLRNIKTMDISEQNRIMEEVSTGLLIHSQKYISLKSFAARKRKEKEPQTGIEVFTVDEDELDALTNRILLQRNIFSIKEVTNYFDHKLKNRDTIQLKNESLVSHYDALMYATAITMTRNNDFQYDVEILNDVVDFGFVRISDVKIKPKKGASR